MDPSTSTFVPTNTTQSQDATQLQIYSSLLRALAAEQQAHLATVTSLQDANARLAEAEGRLSKVESQKLSLDATVKMLKSIIQNQQDKIDEYDSNIDKMQTTKEKAKQEKVDLSNSILYDTLARQREEYEKTTNNGVAGKVSNSGPALPEKSSTQLNDHGIFNLDAMTNLDLGNGQSSALHRSLRKHFVLDTNEQQHTAELVETADMYGKPKRVVPTNMYGNDHLAFQSIVPEETYTVQSHNLASQAVHHNDQKLLQAAAETTSEPVKKHSSDMYPKTQTYQLSTEPSLHLVSALGVMHCCTDL